MLEKLNWHDELLPVMRGAGDILIEYFYKFRSLPRHKKSDNSYYTPADIAAEQYLKKQLLQLVPQAQIYAEESGISGNSDYAWVIDPLDGTTNFAQGIPYWCISVALTYKNSPICASIYNPLMDEFFYADLHTHTTMNNGKVTVTQQSLEEGLVALGFSYDVEKKIRLMHRAEKIVQKAFAIRHFGAIALDLAYTAAGKIDGAFFEGLSWWDVAAGKLLIEQAGGMIGDFKGDQIEPNYSSCMAGGKLIYQAFKELQVIKD